MAVLVSSMFLTVRWVDKIHLYVGQTEQELPVEASGAPQGRIDEVQAIRGADHHNLPSVFQPIHQSEQRRHDGTGGTDSTEVRCSADTSLEDWRWRDGPVDLILSAGPHWSQAIDLIKEDDGRALQVGLVDAERETQLSRVMFMFVRILELHLVSTGGGGHLFKEQPQLPLGLSDPLAEAVGSFPHEEGHLPVAMATLVGQRPGNQRLPRSGGAVKEAPSGKTQREFHQNAVALP